MSRKIERLSIEHHQILASHLREIDGQYRAMREVLNGHVPLRLSDLFEKARQMTLMRLRSELEEEMFRSRQGDPRCGTDVYYGRRRQETEAAK